MASSEPDGAGGEGAEELEARPESMLGDRVKRVLLEAIRRETEKALKEGDDAYAVELQRARKLVARGAWKVRRDNPYLYFMESCLLGRGGSLKATQEAMKECGDSWSKLPKEKKEFFEALARGLAVYDYL